MDAVSAIYTDLDTIFDTRIAVLGRFGIDTVERIVTAGYYTRLYDEFDGVEPDAYRAAYAARDATVLKDALVTPMVNYLHLFARQTLMAYIGTPYRRQPKVVLNTYPYRLTETTEIAIITGLRAATQNLLDIELIHQPLDDLTPSHVKERYAMMAMYAYWEWLEIHSVTKALADSQCQNIGLIGPRLVKSKEAAKQLEGSDVFTAIETYTGLFIKLQLLPANAFCVDLPRLEKTRLRA